MRTSRVCHYPLPLGVRILGCGQTHPHPLRNSFHDLTGSVGNTSVVRPSTRIVAGGHPGPSAPPIARRHVRSPPPGECSVAPIPRSAQTAPPRGPLHAVTPAATPPRLAPCRGPRPRPPHPATFRRSTRLFQYGGQRPGERHGTSAASPATARVRAMLAASLTSPSSFIRPWQVGQASTSTAKERHSYCASRSGIDHRAVR